MPTFGELLSSDDFAGKDLDGRLGDIDLYWDAVKEARPDQAGKAELLRNLSRQGHDAGYRAANSPSGFQRDFHDKNFEALTVIYGRAKDADQDSPEFQSTLKDYGKFLKNGFKEYKEAEEAEREMDGLAENASEARDLARGPRTVKERLGMANKDFAGSIHERTKDAIASESEALKAIQERMSRKGPYVVGDEEIYVERATGRRGEFPEPFRVGNDGDLYNSGEALLLSDEDVTQLARNSGAKKMAVEQFLKDLPEKRRAFAQPLITLAEQAGAMDDLRKPGEGTEVEQALKAIAELRGDVFRNALAGSLDSLGQDINKVPILGRFTEKVIDSESLAKREELFTLLKGYQEDKHDFNLWSSLKGAVGTALPDLALSAMGAQLGVGAARALGAGTKAVSTAGLVGSATLPSVRSAADTLAQAKEQGMGGVAASRLAFASFLSEFGPTVLLGRTGIEKILVPGATKEVVKSGLKNAIGRYTKASGLEIAEEEMSSILGMVTTELELNPDMTFEDVVDSMGEAAMAAGVLGLAGGYSKSSPEAKEREKKARDAEKQGMPRTAESIRAGGDLNPQRKATEADAAVPPADEAEARAQGEPRVRPEGETGLATYGGDFVVKNMKETILRFESGEKTQMLNPRAISLAMKDPNYNVLPTGTILGLRHPETGVWSGKAPEAAEGLDAPVEGSGVVDSPLTPEETSELLEATTEAVGGTLTPEGAVDPSEATTEAVEGIDPTLDADAKIREEIKTEEESFAFLDLDQNGKITETKMKPREAVKELEARDKVLQDLFNCLGS